MKKLVKNSCLMILSFFLSFLSMNMVSMRAYASEQPQDGEKIVLQHVHSGYGGACYYNVYHRHVGGSGSYGGCYCGSDHPTTSSNGTRAYDQNGSSGTWGMSLNGHTVYYKSFSCSYCGASTSVQSYTPVTAGAPYGSHNCVSTTHHYDLSCGKTTSTLESSTFNCTESACGSAFIRCNDATMGLITTTLSGIIDSYGAGATPVSYAWSTGETTDTIEVNLNGVYTCDITWRDNKYTGNVQTVTVSYKVENLGVVISYDRNNTDKNVYGDDCTSDATGMMEDLIVKYAEVRPISDCEYEKTGYQFVEWNTKSDGTGTTFHPDDLVEFQSLLDTYGAEITLYAIWEPVVYVVNYHGNDNWNNQSDYSQSFRYDHWDYLDVNAFRRDAPYTSPQGVEFAKGYDFLGWGYTDDQTVTDYTDGEYVLNLADEQDEEVDLYALWKKEIIVSFDYHGGNFDGHTQPVVISHFVYNAEIYSEYDIMTELTAYADFDADTGVNQLFHRLDNADNLEQVEYRFLGWNNDEGAVIPLIGSIFRHNVNLDNCSGSRSEKLYISDDVTFFAVWEPVLYAKGKMGRSLGDVSEDGRKITVNYVGSNSDTAGRTSVFSPGEQGFYYIKIYGGIEPSIRVTFDEKMTEIYHSASVVNDGLNDPYEKTTDEYTNANVLDYTGLNRQIQVEGRELLRTLYNTFYIPMYLGTEHDPSGVYDGSFYEISYHISSNSYYYRTYKGGTEDVSFSIKFKLLTDSEGRIISTADSLLDNIRIRLY